MGLECLLRVKPVEVDRGLSVKILDAKHCTLSRENVTLQRDEVALQNGKCFAFDAVFDTNVTQHDLYCYCKPLLMSTFINGGNTSVMLHGEHGSGKTHALVGVSRNVVQPDQRGLIVRAAEDLFCILNMKLFDVYVGFSNDKAWDMIGEYHSKFSSLMIAHDKKLKNMVTYKDNKKSAYVTMESIKDVYTMLHIFRSIKAKFPNSHGVFSMCVHRKHSTGFYSHANVHFVELGNATVYTPPVHSYTTVADIISGTSVAPEPQSVASLFSKPSDREVALESREYTAENSGKENLTFDALTAVFMALKSKQHFIPHRNSKLTHYLQDALSDKGHTLWISTVIPTTDHYESSLITFNFASRVFFSSHDVVTSFSVSMKTKCLEDESDFTENFPNEETTIFPTRSISTSAITSVSTSKKLKNSVVHPSPLEIAMSNSKLAYNLIPQQSPAKKKNEKSVVQVDVPFVKSDLDSSVHGNLSNESLLSTANSIGREFSLKSLNKQSPLPEKVYRAYPIVSPLDKSYVDSEFLKQTVLVENCTDSKPDIFDGTRERLDMVRSLSGFVSELDETIQLLTRPAQLDKLVRHVSTHAYSPELLENLNEVMNWHKIKDSMLQSLFAQVKSIARYSAELSEIPYISVGSQSDWEKLLSENVASKDALLKLQSDIESFLQYDSSQLKTMYTRSVEENSRLKLEVALWKREYFRFTSSALLSTNFLSSPIFQPSQKSSSTDSENIKRSPNESISRTNLFEASTAISSHAPASIFKSSSSVNLFQSPVKIKEKNSVSSSSLKVSFSDVDKDSNPEMEINSTKKLEEANLKEANNISEYFHQNKLSNNIVESTSTKPETIPLPKNIDIPMSLPELSSASKIRKSSSSFSIFGNKQSITPVLVAANRKQNGSFSYAPFSVPLFDDSVDSNKLNKRPMSLPELSESKDFDLESIHSDDQIAVHTPVAINEDTKIQVSSHERNSSDIVSGLFSSNFSDTTTPEPSLKVDNAKLTQNRFSSYLSDAANNLLSSLENEKRINIDAGKVVNLDFNVPKFSNSRITTNSSLSVKNYMGTRLPDLA